MSTSMATADELRDAVDADYRSYLAGLFDHFHRNPELSLAEHQTAARMAKELRDSGFDVTEGVGGTGVIAIMENGSGPLVMMRADMDGLPVEEKSGLENASVAKQIDPSMYFGSGTRQSNCPIKAPTMSRAVSSSIFRDKRC